MTIQPNEMETLEEISEKPTGSMNINPREFIDGTKIGRTP